MTLETQFKINSNPNYIRFIRENSIWYKILNIDQLEFKKFEDALKDKYKLKPSDRINKMIDDINMLQKFIEVLK